ncbi:MAG TPA: PilZ domain-containing protein [Polyangia bacterium]|nr:PilZ domain-containing protein [Polyangia bacterium]
MNPLRRDTRKHVRASLELPVVVSDASNRVQGGIRFSSADVSGGGAFLRSDLLFEVGEVLNLDFQLPGGRRIQTRGRVVRVSRAQTDERTPGMGVEFVGLAADDRAAIEERIR